MRISLSGTHSSGKSTLFVELQKQSEFKDWTFIPGPTRKIKSMGFEINETGGDATQLLCLSVDLQNLFFNEGKNVISDRCLLDTYIYTKYLFMTKQVSQSTFESIGLIWEQYKRSYDLILFPNHFEVHIEDDGERSINRNFRDGIYHLFLEEINKNIEILNCYSVGGSVEERVTGIKEIIKLYGN